MRLCFPTVFRSRSRVRSVGLIFKSRLSYLLLARMLTIFAWLDSTHWKKSQIRSLRQTVKQWTSERIMRVCWSMLLTTSLQKVSSTLVFYQEDSKNVMMLLNCINFRSIKKRLHATTVISTPTKPHSNITSNLASLGSLISWTDSSDGMMWLTTRSALLSRVDLARSLQALSNSPLLLLPSRVQLQIYRPHSS